MSRLLGPRSATTTDVFQKVIQHQTDVRLVAEVVDELVCQEGGEPAVGGEVGLDADGHEGTATVFNILRLC